MLDVCGAAAASKRGSQRLPVLPKRGSQRLPVRAVLIVCAHNGVLCSSLANVCSGRVWVYRLCVQF